MSVGEREAVSGLLAMSIVALIWWWRLSGQLEAGLFNGPDALQVWARSVLWVIAIGIAVAIAATLVVNIAYGIANQGEKLDDRRDERDRMIENRSMKWGFYILSISILGVIVDLALGASAFRAMNLVLIACTGSELFKDAFKLVLYRRAA